MTSSQVTVVTGASGALGSALVAHLLAAGHSVIAVERAKSGRSGFVREGSQLVRLQANVESAEELASALSPVEAELGPTTGAVLTAGSWRGGHDFVEPEASEDFRAMLDANLTSASVALRALLPGLRARRYGSVVLLGSRSAARPYDAAGSAAYAASKAALTALAQAIAAEVLDHGVRVNVVLPSTIDSAANRRAMPDADYSRWVTTESLAEVIRFLLSDGARDVSGAALPVYGRLGV